MGFRVIYVYMNLKGPWGALGGFGWVEGMFFLFGVGGGGGRGRGKVRVEFWSRAAATMRVPKFPNSRFVQAVGRLAAPTEKEHYT